MPQPSENQGGAPLGRKPLTRSEAARHASLVRWKKEQPFAQPNQDRIANRVRELLAKNKAKGGKGKGKGGKAKLSAQAKQDQIDNNRSAVYDATGLSDENIDAVDALESGGQPKNAADLVKKGLAEQNSAGEVRLTTAGRAFLHAADHGDTAAARTALTDGRWKAGEASARAQAKVERESERVAKQQAKEQAKQDKLKKAAGGGGGSKKPSKPTEQPVQPGKERSAGASAEAATAAQKKQADNRAKVASEMADGDSGLSPSGSAALTAFADGAQLPKQMAGQLAEMGLLEEDSTGQHRLSYAGRAAINAMNRGDTRAALDAISRAADRTKAKADTEQRKADGEKKRVDAQTAREKTAAERKQAQAERTAKEDASRARIERARIETARSRNRKAWAMSELEIKQSAEDRAMFAHMGGGKGKGKGYDKSKSKLNRDKADGGGDKEDVNPATAPMGHPSRSRPYSPEGLAAHAGEGHQSFLGFEHENGLQVSVMTNTNHKNTPVKGTHQVNIRQPDGQTTSMQMNTKRLKHFGGQLQDRGMIYVSPHVSLEGGSSKSALIENTDMNDELDTLTADLLEIKAGARHSRTDQQHVQAIHDSAVACGASCGDDDADGDSEDDELDDDAEKAIKSIQDNPQWYASHECGDVSQACSALQTLAMLIQSELSEEDEDDAQIGTLCDAARILVRFIGAELDELQGQAGKPMPTKGIELVTLDSGEEIAIMGGAAVKSITTTPGLVGGYLVKFGGDGDLSQYRDVFTKDTNFGKHTKSDVWVHHRMLPGLGKKQLTNQAEIGMDDEGVFVKHLLDLRSSYEAKLYGMVQAGKLGWSSGTAPHIVDRKALGDGRHEITQWTLGLDASYTPMPAGGFVVNAGAMKSLLDEAGIDLLNALYIDDNDQEAGSRKSTKADGRQVDDERARVLLLELDILQLETQ
jgi:hypothetical protein